MPEIKEGESEADYVSRCIPARIHEKGETAEQAAAACHGMYRQHKEKGTQYTNNRGYMCLDLCHDNAIAILSDKEPVKTELDKPEVEGHYEKYHAIAIRGDRFYKGKFFPASELMKCHMDGTIHDINHMATTFDTDSFGNSRQNIEYEVGFQRGQQYDPVSKQLSTTIYISRDAPKYGAWKNHVELCKETKKTPNLSISFFFDNKQVRGSELPDTVDLSENGYTRDSMVPCISNVDMQALSTVFKGACSDKDGCGIGLGYAEDAPGLKPDDYEAVIQKCIEDAKKLHPEIPVDKLRRDCTFKYSKPGMGGDVDRETAGRSADIPKDKIMDYEDIVKKKIELEKEKKRGETWKKKHLSS